MSSSNQFISNFTDNSADLGTKFVSKSYLMDVYPYLSTIGNLQFPGLRTWGRNNYGQLGDITLLDKSSPVQTAASGTNWKQVACGYLYTAAIKTDGTLWSWGRNNYGQIGDGTSISTTVFKSTPVQVGLLTNWKQVTCGFQHTAAIKTDGTLWTWGYNNYGQLGDSTLIDKSLPVQVGSMTNWKQVACGFWHTAAIQTDGTLWTWGYNLYGQLGDGTASPTVFKSSPVKVGLLTNWNQVAGGLYHRTAAIKTDGTLWTWGFNNYGQLGDGSLIDKSSPVYITGISNWKQVSCGNYHTAAITTDGTLWAWGLNTRGQLGDSTIDNKSLPVQVGSLTNWKQVGCGDAHTAAIKTDGTLWSAGYNGDGQLGDGTVITKSSPVQVGLLTNWKQVSGGFDHAAAIQEMGDDF
jgi:alpha-tubulin suppressor-like RCC1 family protein